MVAMARIRDFFGGWLPARWDAWHRHMALVMIAMLFVVKERLLLKQEAPLVIAGRRGDGVGETVAQARTYTQTTRQTYSRATPATTGCHRILSAEGWGNMTK